MLPRPLKKEQAVAVLECARPAAGRDVALPFNTGFKFEKNKLSFPQKEKNKTPRLVLFSAAEAA